MPCAGSRTATWTDGLEVIYEKLGRRIYLLALSVLRDGAAAEDVMQEVFLRLASSTGSYREGSNASAYILTVTRNLAIDALNRRKREAPSEIPEDIAADNESPSLRALEALSLLGEDERQIVILKLEGGMKHRDIAPIIGIGTAACEKRYRRALEKLKKYYC